MTEITLGSAVFVAIVLTFSALIMAARAFLLPTGTIAVTLNHGRQIQAAAGRKLLEVLQDEGIAIPAACGGSGTCGQCRLHITKGAGVPMPTDAALISRSELMSGMRLACQTTIREELGVSLADELLDARTWRCKVVSSRTVAPIIREIVLSPLENEPFEFTPGAFVQIKAPAYEHDFADFEIAEEHRPVWRDLGIGRLHAKSSRAVSRAYSIASRALDDPGRIVLLIRLALPPPSRPDLPPGVVSSWLFGLRPGATIEVTGPFGSFRAQQSDREMIFIGGGVGMAPLRAIISDQLEKQNTARKITYWYGARRRVDLFFNDEFARLETDHANFRWVVALSDPAQDDNWDGEVGFIHDVALRSGLSDHPAPHECEYYLCGPPTMIRAVLAMLDELGVDRDHIFNDDFGG